MYQHSKQVHNTKSAEIIVPIIMDMLLPKSVVDVGCGTGTWLAVFKNNGVSNYLGIDGEYLDPKKLVIPKEHFLSADLREPIRLNDRFNVALSLEVAEHIPESSASLFVESLISLSDRIIFSAAIPGQGGQNHLNEQWPEYWIKKFNEFDYHFYDVFRLNFWDNPEIDWWYKQNIFLVLKKGLEQEYGFKNPDKILAFVHPELYNYRIQIIKNLMNEFHLERQELDDLNYKPLPFKTSLRNFVYSLTKKFK